MKYKAPFLVLLLFVACSEESSLGPDSPSSLESSASVLLSSSEGGMSSVMSSSSVVYNVELSSSVEKNAVSGSSEKVNGSSASVTSSANIEATNNMVIDERDGKKYKTVTIGTQTWFAENLAYNLKDKNNRIAYNCPNEEMSNCSIYGNLYDQWGLLDLFDGPVYYPAVPANARPFKGLCPKGWHIPSIEEWQELLNNAYVQDLVAKSAGGTGESGFDVLLLGGVGWNGAIYFEEAGIFASVDERDDQNMVCAKFTPSSVTTSTLNHSFFVAIRCLKD